jgi:hypothetical protein
MAFQYDGAGVGGYIGPGVTRWVAFWKSCWRAMNFCGLRSVSESQELCTWTMMGWPLRNVW